MSVKPAAVILVRSTYSSRGLNVVTQPIADRVVE